MPSDSSQRHVYSWLPVCVSVSVSVSLCVCYCLPLRVSCWLFPRLLLRRSLITVTTFQYRNSFMEIPLRGRNESNEHSTIHRSSAAIHIWQTHRHKQTQTDRQTDR